MARESCNRAVPQAGRCLLHQELLQAQLCLFFLLQKPAQLQALGSPAGNSCRQKKGFQLSLQPSTKLQTTTLSVHESDCSLPHGYSGIAPSSSSEQTGQIPAVAPSARLLSPQAGPQLPQGCVTHLKDSPSPGARLCTSRT